MSGNSSFINESQKNQLRDLFSKGLKEDVRIVHFTQEFECSFCKECRELLQELSSISDKIKLELYDFVKDSDKAKEFNVDKIPATIITNGKTTETTSTGNIEDKKKLWCKILWNSIRL